MQEAKVSPKHRRLVPEIRNDWSEMEVEEKPKTFKEIIESFPSKPKYTYSDSQSSTGTSEKHIK